MGPHDNQTFGVRFEFEGSRYWLVSAPTHRSNPKWEGLTHTERDVLDLVLAGRTNDEIAALRRRSHNTIRNQIASAYRKLNINSRTELAALVT